MPMGTKLAVYRNEIRRLHEMSDDLCVSVSALLGHIARMKATHAEAMCANAGTGPCPRCASYVEEIIRLRACTDSAGQGTGQGADRALRWAAQALSERDGEVRRLKEELDKRDDMIEWFKAELDKIRQELERRSGRLKRYENATTPGRHGYNEDRAIIRAEELKKFAEENGIEIVENHKIGPPEGHEGVCHRMHVEKTVHHEMKKCPRCGNEHLKRRHKIAKLILDFDGETRFLILTLHKGRCMRCDHCRQTFKPKFPSIEGTAFGIGVLGYILEYAGKKNTDGDIAYYLKVFNKYKRGATTIWNARKALAVMLAPSVRLIIDELKKAPFLMIDETPYPYKKKKAYVWVVRTDTATLVMPAPGRGALCAPSFLRELRHIPVVVDGYVVYDGLFAVIQRCWAHVLLKAEETYITCKDPATKEVHKESYFRLAKIHRRAKSIAAATAHLGGANIRTCLELEKEVACMVAAYGNDSFATYLENAMPHLFTFLRYPGMPSTNNKTEQDIRDAVVMQRKFRQKFVTAEGMGVFSMLMSFHSTCHKLNVIPSEMFERIFESPDFDFMSYGLSVLNPKALPAPPSDTGVELSGDCTAGTIQPDEEVELAGDCTAGTIQPDEEVELAGDCTAGTIQPDEEVELAGDCTAGTIQPDEEVELAGDCTAWTAQGKDTAEPPSEPSLNHSVTTAAPTTPDNIMATIAVVAAAVCDLTDGPTRPSHPACNTTARTGQDTATPKPIAVPCGKPPPA